MSTAALLPAVPKPPHDPMSWLLDSSAGWRGARFDKVEMNHTKNSLALELKPGHGRYLAEPGGSFGGLVLPGHVALDHDVSVWLLDKGKGLLKRFDPCTCRFEFVPCIGGIGTNPRQFQAPEGIGICGGESLCL